MLITPFERAKNGQWLLAIGIHELLDTETRNAADSRWGYTAAWTTTGTWSKSMNHKIFPTIESAEKYLRENRETMQNAHLE